MSSASLLSFHTPQTLLNELISGRSVSQHDGIRFSIDSPIARQLLIWYSKNERRWTENVTDDIIESLLTALTAPVDPTVSAPTPVPPAVPMRYHLTRMRAYRFGGIHSYHATVDDIFDVDLSKPLISVTGKNGSGKTSIVSAISWCLTGMVHHPLDEPTRAEKVPIHTEDLLARANMPAVSPVPPSTILARGDRVAYDTWVELEFVTEDQTSVRRIRRSLGPRGAADDVQSDMTVDPMALHTVSVLPGAIHHLRLGKRSTLGAAVSALTGFRALTELVSHTERSRKRITSRTIPSLSRRVADHQARIADLEQELVSDAAENNLAGIQHGGCSSLGDWQRLRSELDAEHERRLTDGATLLGATSVFTSAQRREFGASIAAAEAAISLKKVGQGASAQRLKRLSTIAESECVTAETVIRTLQSEAQQLHDVQSNPELAARIRLYARVAGWTRAERTGTGQCPLCGTNLARARDPVDGRNVETHLHECEGREDLLAQTVESWDRDAERRLAEDVSQMLQEELRTTEEADPHLLMKEAFIRDVLLDDAFGGVLSGLKGPMHALWTSVAAELPAFTPSQPPVFPPEFANSRVARAAMKLSRSISAARWRRAHSKTVTTLFARLIGRIEAPAAESDPTNWPLGARLHTLRLIAERTAPVERATRLIDRLMKELTEIDRAKLQLDLATTVATELSGLQPIREFVNGEVKALVATLYRSTVEWKKALYAPASTEAPSLSGASVGAGGEVLLEMQSGGTQIAAEAVANASALRAALVAFLFAFWEYCWNERGGISLLVLDDLHDLFDPENRRSVARTLPLLVARGAHVICTSNDEAFARDIDKCGAESLAASGFQRRCVQALSPIRRVIGLGFFREEVDRKREQFKKNPEDSSATEYLMTLRTFFEHRLATWFEQQTLQPPPRTLSDLLSAAKRERSVGIEPFTLTAFGVLLDDPALQQRSTVLGLLNQAHHHTGSLIVASHVIAAESDILRVCGKLDDAIRARDYWLERNPSESQQRRPQLYVLPHPMDLPPRSLPVRWELAAFTAETSEAGGQLAEDELPPSWFENKATYRVARPTFGFACPRGSVAVVQLSSEEVMDNRLVIALHQSHTYARRLLRSKTHDQYIALGSEQEDPTKRARSETFLQRDVQLLKVVGVLFDDNPMNENFPGEAVPCEAHHLLAKAEVVYRVQGVSALPLALEKQWVVGGRRDPASGSRSSSIPRNDRRSSHHYRRILEESRRRRCRRSAPAPSRINWRPRIIHGGER